MRKSQIKTVTVEMKNGTLYRVDAQLQRAQVVPWFGQPAEMSLDTFISALDYVARGKDKVKHNIGWL